MGTITTDQAEKWKESGIIDKKIMKSLEKDGLISTRRKSQTVKMKTADDVWVVPTLYYRGGKGTTLSDQQVSLNKEFDALCKKYGTINTK